jgi:hypothetical protein
MPETDTILLVVYKRVRVKRATLNGHSRQVQRREGESR